MIEIKGLKGERYFINPAEVIYVRADLITLHIYLRRSEPIHIQYLNRQGTDENALEESLQAIIKGVDEYNTTHKSEN